VYRSGFPGFKTAGSLSTFDMMADRIIKKGKCFLSDVSWGLLIIVTNRDPHDLPVFTLQNDH
jgi:hypothetical protein